MKTMTLSKQELFLVIEEIANVKVEKEEFQFIEDLHFDSMDTVVFLSMLEIDYGIYIPDDLVTELKTVQSVIDYLKL